MSLVRDVKFVLNHVQIILLKILALHTMYRVEFPEWKLL